MELVSIQALLARLYTDQAFREQFLNAPELTARPYQIGKSDLEKLIQLANGPALRFSKTLIRKRFGQVAAFLPATRRVLGAQMWEAFLSFAGNYNPKGVGRHLFDAIEFSVFLTKVFKNRINVSTFQCVFIYLDILRDCSCEFLHGHCLHTVSDYRAVGLVATSTGKMGSYFRS